ncbi:hypothetical protein EYF80_027221 [Liparis tanakae]|uniref:Uncharacterized protein n=1 Tax=Liparis tanakae TaxID=230148 RepID=A0A4Z2H9G8_9TELE|nr:hypothetical protein EYF80_027221 [Liparis tanakae]
MEQREADAEIPRDSQASSVAMWPHVLLRGDLGEKSSLVKLPRPRGQRRGEEPPVGHREPLSNSSSAA